MKNITDNLIQGEIKYELYHFETTQSVVNKCLITVTM